MEISFYQSAIDIIEKTNMFNTTEANFFKISIENNDDHIGEEVCIKIEIPSFPKSTFPIIHSVLTKQVAFSILDPFSSKVMVDNFIYNSMNDPDINHWKNIKSEYQSLIRNYRIKDVLNGENQI